MTRVEHGAHVFDHVVALHLDRAGLRVHLHFAQVATVGKGRGGRSEARQRRQPGVLPRRTSPGIEACLHDIAQCDLVVGAPHPEAPRVELDVLGRRLQESGGNPAPLLHDALERPVQRIAAEHRAARARGAASVGDAVGVSLYVPDLLEFEAEAFRDDLAEHRLVPLPVGMSPERHGGGAVGIETHLRALVAHPGGLLYRVRDAEPAQAARGARACPA